MNDFFDTLETRDPAVREAALLALEERRDVVFEFNGKNYKVSPFEIVDFLFSKAG